MLVCKAELCSATVDEFMKQGAVHDYYFITETGDSCAVQALMPCADVAEAGELMYVFVLAERAPVLRRASEVVTLVLMRDGKAQRKEARDVSPEEAADIFDRARLLAIAYQRKASVSNSAAPAAYGAAYDQAFSFWSLVQGALTHAVERVAGMGDVNLPKPRV